MLYYARVLNWHVARNLQQQIYDKMAERKHGKTRWLKNGEERRRTPHLRGLSATSLALKNNNLMCVYSVDYHLAFGINRQVLVAVQVESVFFVVFLIEAYFGYFIVIHIVI